VTRALLLRNRLQVVQAAKEEQVGDLLDHLQRVADAARPEGIPDAVDLALELPSDHAVRLSMRLALVHDAVDDGPGSPDVTAWARSRGQPAVRKKIND